MASYFNQLFLGNVASGDGELVLSESGNITTLRDHNLVHKSTHAVCPPMHVLTERDTFNRLPIVSPQTTSY